MRLVLLFLLGAVIGAAAATSVVNALARRDAYLRGVMQVLEHDYAGLRAGIRAGTCDARWAQARPALAAMTESIEAAYAPGAAPDAPFREYTQRLRDAVAQLPGSAASCAAAAAAVSKVGDACEACHHQYR